MKDGPQKLFADSLPSHGYGTDNLEYGVRFMPLSELIQKAIVQFNWRHSVKFLAYDIDSESAIFDWYDNNYPPPNILVLNPSNGHAHYLYGLEVPVHKYEGASVKALRYMSAVDIALTETLKADPGYSKLLCKNPLSNKWIVSYPRQEAYDLDELSSWVDMDKYKDRRRRLPDIGYGRNVNLFNAVRSRAYRERREPFLSEELFRYSVSCHAMAVNAEFDKPLPHSEVRATVKSITRWTWRNISAAGFKQWGDDRRAVSARVRKEKSMNLRQQIVEAVEQCPSLSQEDIAAMMGCSRETVNRHLRAYKGSVTSVISDKGSNSGSVEVSDGR